MAYKTPADTMGRSRALQAAEETERMGCISQGEKERLVKELRA